LTMRKKAILAISAPLLVATAYFAIFGLRTTRLVATQHDAGNGSFGVRRLAAAFLPAGIGAEGFIRVLRGSIFCQTLTESGQ